MSVREIVKKPKIMGHFPDGEYRWLRLHDAGLVYGYAAIGERGDDLELHVSLTRWGPRIRRQIKGDLSWLKEEAKRLGKRRILGIRINVAGEFSPNLFRFARLFGFTDMCVLQTAALNVQG